MPGTQPKYPDVWVPLEGEDGNAFSIIGRVGVALKQAGVPREEIEEFRTVITSGAYNHLLPPVMAYVHVGHHPEEAE